MDNKLSMSDMIPFAALTKLSASKDISKMSDREFLLEFSSLVNDYELLYHDISEHEGFPWGDKD